ncbi:MAG: hypothetical protein ABSE98_09025 [Acidimicrobiales bacterium]|jgi:hypothetical protein
MVTVKEAATPTETGLGLATTLTVNVSGAVVGGAGTLVLVGDSEVEVGGAFVAGTVGR